MLSNVKCYFFIMVVSFSIYKPVQGIASMAVLQILAVHIALCSAAGGVGSFGGKLLADSDKEKSNKKQDLKIEENNKPSYVLSMMEIAAGVIIGAVCFGTPTGLLAGLYSAGTGMTYAAYTTSWFPPISAVATGLWIGKAVSEPDTSELLKK